MAPASPVQGLFSRPQNTSHNRQLSHDHLPRFRDTDVPGSFTPCVVCMTLDTMSSIRSEQSVPKYKPLMSDAEFAKLIEGKYFAKGTARVAFNVLSDHDVVIKKARAFPPSSNFLEWFIWQSALAQNGQLAKILGKCHAISKSGRYLMMEHLDDLTNDDYADVPDVPVWFNDPKPSAFGKRGGTIKIRDYGLVKMDQLVLTSLSHPPAFVMSARTERQMKR